MMDAEEDLDLDEEISGMMLNSGDTSEFSLLSKSGSHPSSAHSSKTPSLAGDLCGKVEDEDLLDDKASKSKPLGSGTHTPTPLEAAGKSAPARKKVVPSPGSPTKSASDLFGSDSGKDLFAVGDSGVINSSNSSQPLFADQPTPLELPTTQSSSSGLFGASSLDSNFLNHNPAESSFSVPPSTSQVIQEQHVLQPTNQPFTNGGVTYTDNSAVMSAKLASPVGLPSAEQYSFSAPNAGYNELSGVVPQMNNLSITNTPQVQGQPTPNLYYNPGQYNNSSLPGSLNPQQSSAPQPNVPVPLYYTPEQQQQQQQTSAGSQHVLPQSQPSSAPFIPDMYSGKQGTTPNMSQFFVPTQPAEPPATNQIPSSAGASMYNGYPQPPVAPSQPFAYDHQNSHNGGYSNNYTQLQTVDASNEAGIWDWISNPGSWSEGAQKLKEGIKTATDKVLTTLDPGMEEYLKPVINVGVASQNTNILLGMRHGIGNAYGVAMVKGQHVSSQLAAMPVGFEVGIRGVNQLLEAVQYVNFEFSSHYVMVAAQPFVTELTPGKWFAMFCLGLKDAARNLVIHSFSQPIPLPIDVVTTAYNRSAQNTGNEDFTGYDISLEEAVRLHVPYTKEQDWCSALSGMSVQQVIAIAAQCLTCDYKRQTENNAVALQYQQQQNQSANYPYQQTQEHQFQISTQQQVPAYGSGQEAYDLGL